MPRIRTLVAALLLAALLPACEGPTVPEPFDGDLLVQVREAHGAAFDQVGEPGVGVFLLTEEEYACTNYRVQALVEAVDSVEIDVEVFGVRRPDACREGVAPATYSAMLPIGEGEYTLRVREGAVADRFRLTVLADRIVLEPETTTFTRAPHPLFWNYPPDTFALVCHAPAEAEDAECGALAERLVEGAGSEPYTFPGEGAIPYPVAAGEDGEMWRVSYFSYDGVTGWEAAGAVAAETAEAAPDLLFYLMNWHNERHLSWDGEAEE